MDIQTIKITKPLIKEPMNHLPKMEEMERIIRSIMNCIILIKRTTRWPTLFQRIILCITKLNIRENIKHWEVNHMSALFTSCLMFRKKCKKNTIILSIINQSIIGFLRIFNFNELFLLFLLLKIDLIFSLNLIN